MSFPTLYRWLGIWTELLGQSALERTQLDTAVRLLHLALHFPRALSHPYSDLACTALAIVAGVPQVERRCGRPVNSALLEWMLPLLGAPSLQPPSRVKRRRTVSAEEQMAENGADLEYCLAEILP